jgi:hypothetical protein
MRDIMRGLQACHAADWLALAAAPTFALMAVVTGLLDGGAHQTACSATMSTSSLGGMVPMYLLMSGFHLTPWVKLISRPRGSADGMRAWRRAALPGRSG